MHMDVMRTGQYIMHIVRQIMYQIVDLLLPFSIFLFLLFFLTFRRLTGGLHLLKTIFKFHWGLHWKKKNKKKNIRSDELDFGVPNRWSYTFCRTEISVCWVECFVCDIELWIESRWWKKFDKTSRRSYVVRSILSTPKRSPGTIDIFFRVYLQLWPQKLLFRFLF